VNAPNFGPGTDPDVLRRWTTGAARSRSGSAATATPRCAEQVAGDLERLRSLGADPVVLDPFNGDPDETARPQSAWQALAAVAARWSE
jgi:hypothetical protein